MNAVPEAAPRVKRKYKKRRKTATPQVQVDPPEKPDLPALNPLDVAIETARNAQEGNRKLSLSVDALRSALETIVMAEIDTRTGLPVSTKDLRQIAIEGLDAYSALVGQSWRRNKIITSRAGDRDTSTLGE